MNLKSIQAKAVTIDSSTNCTPFAHLQSGKQVLCHEAFTKCVAYDLLTGDFFPSGRAANISPWNYMLTQDVHFGIITAFGLFSMPKKIQISFMNGLMAKLFVTF
ncbi:MAG: hypothetical protein EOM20_14970 [Spartobacteria bacterium]|nr:hypothetical protein [Spartobacteria bacterium]